MSILKHNPDRRGKLLPRPLKRVLLKMINRNQTQSRWHLPWKTKISRSLLQTLLQRVLPVLG